VSSHYSNRPGAHYVADSMTYNLSELFERVADAVPGRTAVITPSHRRTYAELDDRSTRLAHHLAGAGVGAGDHVGLLLENGPEYLEAMLAAFKLRAVPVNVNYRYVERELSHLFNDARIVALVFHRRFGPRVAAVAPDVPSLGHLIVVADDSDAPPVATAHGYEEAIASGSPTRDFVDRSGDDRYLAYTGGTTGLPKGVEWRHEDIFFASMGGGDPTTLVGPISSPDELVGRILDPGAVQLITPPLMHVSAHWGAFQTLYGGGTVVLSAPGPFDGAAILRLASDTGANVITLVGDAMARPLIDALDADPAAYDLTPLFVVASGGALLSPTVKAELHRALPAVIVIDGFGSTETGVAGSHSSMPGADDSAGARFRMDATTTVLDDDLQPIEPGSGRIGRLARCGHLPIGYLGDPEKTAETFVEAAGVRWVLPGDLASIDADGTIVLLGRGSLSINTGGEKVFPDEVEATLVSHPSVRDALVVGVPDERWGQRVVAVVEPSTGATPELDELQVFCREALAGYKVPRGLVVVERVERGPNGKADYRWAQARAEAASS